MTTRTTPRSRILTFGAALTLAASALVFNGSTAAAQRPAPDSPCFVGADAAERLCRAEAAPCMNHPTRPCGGLPELRCAVTPDAAERRGARHPGDICRV
ncbi:MULTISPECIES: hypothetical protein [unclassified Nocardioides]|uniref:hypothetical protein n=1 Tax=unclassified Nocardioides TaxID=2615069 RepID=UPI003608A934